MIFFQGGGGNPINALIDAINLLLAGGGVGSGIATPPADPLDYGILALILVYSLFIERKAFFILFVLTGYAFFGFNGVAVALIYWVLFAIIQLGFDFFRRRFV